jgi:hypothetical protein
MCSIVRHRYGPNYSPRTNLQARERGNDQCHLSKCGEGTHTHTHTGAFYTPYATGAVTGLLGRQSSTAAATVCWLLPASKINARQRQWPLLLCERDETGAAQPIRDFNKVIRLRKRSVFHPIPRHLKQFYLLFCTGVELGVPHKGRT